MSHKTSHRLIVNQSESIDSSDVTEYVQSKRKDNRSKKKMTVHRTVHNTWQVLELITFMLFSCQKFSSMVLFAFTKISFTVDSFTCNKMVNPIANLWAMGEKCLRILPLDPCVSTALLAVTVDELEAAVGLIQPDM